MNKATIGRSRLPFTEKKKRVLFKSRQEIISRALDFIAGGPFIISKGNIEKEERHFNTGNKDVTIPLGEPDIPKNTLFLGQDFHEYTIEASNFFKRI